MTTDRYWFHVADLPDSSSDIPLPEDQAHHARAVLRLESNTPIILFDGRGSSAEALLQTPTKRTAIAHLTTPIRHDPEPATQLTLATAVPKGDRAEWLVEQASQLGVTSIQWLDCDRGVVKPRNAGESSGGGKLDKWRRLATESAKQCGRTWVLRIEPLAPLDHILTAATGEGARHAKTLWLEPRQGAPLAPTIEGAADIVALIGPEGGWSDHEMELLSQAAANGLITRVKLTPTILRIETACAAVAAIIGCR